MAKKKMPNKKLTTKFCKLLAEAAEVVRNEESSTHQFKIPSEKKISENGKSKLEQNLAHFNVSDGTDTVLQNTPEENKETEGLKLGTEAENVLNSTLMPEADTFRMMAATLQNMVISKAEHEKVKKGKDKDRQKPQNGIEEKDARNSPKACEHLDEAASVVSSSSSSSSSKTYVQVLFLFKQLSYYILSFCYQNSSNTFTILV